MNQPECRKPKVSVIVPIMNVEDYLRQALDSLAGQTLEEMEFILIDDGSTDRSPEIMQAYAEGDKRFLTLSKPNSGYGHTMNMGLDMARGEYVGILEPDDFAEPDMFRRLYAEAFAHGLDFVKSDFNQFTVNPDGTLKKKPVFLSPDDRYYNRTFCPEKEKEVFFFPINTWTGIYRRDFLEEHHIRHHETPGASFQDNGFWFQTFCHGKRVRFIRDRLYQYRVDNPNASMKSREKEQCITEEYRWIHGLLEADPPLLKAFEKVMYNKQLMSMLLTYSRLNADRKLPYLRHMQEELAKPYRQKWFDRSYLHPLDWQRLDRIMADPEAFAKTVDVSVILHGDHSEAEIDKSIRSVLFPSLINAEVIYVGGGEDGEPEDPRVHIYPNEGTGAEAARETGRKHAKGEYLAFAEAGYVFDAGWLDGAWNRAKTEGLKAGNVLYPETTGGGPGGIRQKIRTCSGMIRHQGIRPVVREIRKKFRMNNEK